LGELVLLTPLTLPGRAAWPPLSLGLLPNAATVGQIPNYFSGRQAWVKLPTHTFLAVVMSNNTINVYKKAFGGRTSFVTLRKM
jgi:hypothetical protein